MNPDAFVQAFEALHFLRPQWLWALLALPLLAWAWHRRRVRQSVWRNAIDAHLLPHLLERGEGRRGITALGALLLGYAIAVLALAGPSWRQGEQPLLQGEAPLVVALEMSSAMLAEDLPPSRLLQARAKLATLLDRRSGGQVGLLVFADDAYTVAPLTRDAANVALFLDSLAPDVMPVDGSHPARGIERAVRLLDQAGFEGGDILVVGSHGGDDARAAAAVARNAGYRVSALGLGTPAGTAYRTAQGAIAHARLDAASLRAMASAGGGDYETLSAGTADLAALGVLDASAAGRVDAGGGKATAWRDGGYWLLLPLMLLGLFAFRRGGGFAALLLCACLPWHQALAADDGTLWQRADQVRHERLQRGADAYRSEDYAAATDAWAGLPGADAAYNRGNALARAGRYEDAIAAYDEALRRQPGMADAIANRELVEAAMKRKPPPSPQSGARGDQQQSPDSGKPNDDKSGQGEDSGEQPPQSEGTGPRDAQDSPDDGKPGEEAGERDEPQPQSPPEPSDTEAQRKADAQQRARMQQALEQQAQSGERGDDGSEAAGEPAPQPSAAEREMQRANEAWLRRVPDDPGGLLRAKFRLEHERRMQTGER